MARTRLLSLLAAVAVSIVALTATRPTLSAVATDDEALVLSAAWLVTAAVTTWYALGLAMCTAARLSPGRPGLRWCTAFAPRLVQRAAGVAWGASLLFAPTLAQAPAGAASHPPFVAVDEPFVRAPAPAPAPTSTIAMPTIPTTAPLAEAPAPVAPPTAAVPPATRHHIVVAGENLWSIAAAELAGHGETSERAVAAYWRTVVEANRAALRSGNPNLIFPGEVIALPPHG
ncbi:MAG: hypothetical protein ABWZ15_01240 [Acidimicrobiia bacterium]